MSMRGAFISRALGVGCHQFVLEKPTFPLPSGKYLVTGDRTVTTVLPGLTMPDVKGCRKQDYTVLIVVGLPATR